MLSEQSFESPDIAKGRTHVSYKADHREDEAHGNDGNQFAILVFSHNSSNLCISSLFYHTETIDGLLLVALTRIQYNAWEVRTIWCVGEVLSLKAYC